VRRMFDFLPLSNRETAPLIPTADGVREEGNRAVVITLQ